MLHSYDKSYLEGTMKTIGYMYDYAVNVLDFDIDEFSDYFISSSVASEIERGNPAYLGKSEIELVQIICEKKHIKKTIIPPHPRYEKSSEYWVGSTLAYYQWLRGFRFETILKSAKASELRLLYSPLHEADITKYEMILDSKIKESPSNLKRMRQLANLSQSELANISGVNIRTIKAYEQKENDINKAGVHIIRALSLAIGCKIEDLLE